MREISFLIAMALRSSRIQRLTLLFHLMLVPKKIEKILHSHPSGGVPTWLLEVETEWILSFASLAHYYYYGGIASVGIDPQNKSSKATFDAGTAPRELKVDILTVIESLGVAPHGKSLLNQIL